MYQKVLKLLTRCHRIFNIPEIKTRSRNVFKRMISATSSASSLTHFYAHVQSFASCGN